MSKSFGKVDAVQDVHISLHAGTVTGLIGANGAGKTTLLNMISGLVRPTKGFLRIDGSLIARPNPPAQARLGVVRTFQHPRLVPHLTVLENVMLAGRSAGRRLPEVELADRAIEALVATDVERERWTKQVREVPPADHRWIEIARVTASSPRVALFDEPSSGFTEGEVKRLIGLLSKLSHESGVAILLVTHDVSLAAQCSDLIHVMDRGRTIAEGEARSVLAQDVVRTAYLGERTSARLRAMATAPDGSTHA